MKYHKPLQNLPPPQNFHQIQTRILDIEKYVNKRYQRRTKLMHASQCKITYKCVKQCLHHIIPIIVRNILKDEVRSILINTDLLAIQTEMSKEFGKVSSSPTPIDPLNMDDLSLFE